MNKLMSTKDYTALVGKIGTTQSELTAAIQSAAVTAIGYAACYGQATPATQLFDAMGKSVRRDSLLKFFEVNGPLMFDKTTKTFRINKNATTPAYDDDRIAELLKTPWNEAKKQPEPVSTFDIDDMFTKFLASTRKKVEEAKLVSGAQIKNLKLLDMLSVTASKYYDVVSGIAVANTTADTTDMDSNDLIADWDLAIAEDSKRTTNAIRKLMKKAEAAKATQKEVNVQIPGLAIAA